MNNFEDDTDSGIIARLKPIIPHVDPLITVAANATAIVALAAVQADIVALAAEKARLLALAEQQAELAQIAANTASVLALIAAKPIFVPEYRAFVVPS